MNRALLLAALAALAIGLGFLGFRLRARSAAPVLEAGVGIEAPAGGRDSEALALEPGGDAGADAAAPARAAVAASASPPVAALDLRGGLTGFRGRVVDFAGKPVPDCGVRIYRLAVDSMLQPGFGRMGAALPEPVIEAGEAQTADDGTFSIGGVWPRAFYVLLAGIGTDWPTHKILERTPSPGELTDLGDVALLHGAIVTGVLESEEGEPLAGATVRAADLPGVVASAVRWEQFDPCGALFSREGGPPVPVIEMPLWVERVFEHLPLPTARTDEQGSFRLVGLAPGSNMIVATLPDYLGNVQAAVVLAEGEERDLGTIFLEHGERVAGEVVDGQGAPVAGARVAVAAVSAMIPMDFARFLAPTDELGRFAGAGFPPGLVSVAAQRGPGEPWVLAEPQPASAEIQIALPAVHSLTVEVAGQGSEPLREVELELVHGDDSEPLLWMHALGFGGRIDLAGRLERLEDGRLLVAGLSAGSYVVRARAAGHAVGVEEFELSADREVALRLEPERPFAVRVLDPTGAGLAGAAIVVAPEGGPKIPIPCGRTGADGRLAIDEVSAEAIRVTAEHAAYGSVHAEGDTSAGEIVLTMQAPGSIAGLVSDRGAAPSPGEWIAFLERSSVGEAVVEETPTFAVPDLEGAFHLRALQPGEYSLSLISSLGGVRSLGSLISFANESLDSCCETSVAVLPGQEVSVVLDLGAGPEGPSAMVSGSVTLNGVPGEGLLVRAQSYGRGGRRSEATVDARGRFDLERLSAGTVRVNVTRGAAMQTADLWATRLELEPEGHTDLAIEIEVGSLSGKAAFADERPAQACLVGLWGSGGIQQSSQTDSQGHFSFPELPAGLYAARVEGGDPPCLGVASVSVAAGERTDVHFEVEPAVALSGLVEMAAWSEPPSWLAVDVSSLDREPSISALAYVGEEGEFATNHLVPGRYEVTFQGDLEGIAPFREEIELGPAGLEDLVLRPSAK